MKAIVSKIAELANQGLMNTEIASQLGMSNTTVGYHIRKMILPLDVQQKRKAAALAAKLAGRKTGITAKDIAAKCGLSVTTVRSVIQKGTASKVRDITKQLVINTANELGYNWSRGDKMRAHYQTKEGQDHINNIRAAVKETLSEAAITESWPYGERSQAFKHKAAKILKKQWKEEHATMAERIINNIPTTVEHDWENMSEEERRKACEEKDKLTNEILKDIVIADPSTFRAILMPTLSSPEYKELIARGVPAINLFAIEANRSRWTALKAAGLNAGDKSADILPALATIYGSWQYGFNLIYLDLLSQLSHNYLNALKMVFKLGLLKEGATFILTSSKGRTRQGVPVLNESINPDGIPNEEYIINAVKYTGHRSPTAIKSLVYNSPMRGKNNCVRDTKFKVTVATF